jgi:hypothetical protein
MRSTMKESRQSHARRTERSTQELAPSMEAKGRDTRSNRITDEHARGSNDVLCSGGESRNFEIGAGAGHSYRNTSNTGLHRTICVVEVKDISDRGPYVIRESAGNPAIHISCLHTHTHTHTLFGKTRAQSTEVGAECRAGRRARQHGSGEVRRSGSENEAHLGLGPRKPRTRQEKKQDAARLGRDRTGAEQGQRRLRRPRQG